mmetsp:Transcript_10485/g.10539  ORF Transcript_10485/g.10539 Transcript_10485/m.10539 type:complete len:83 (-) Transcript_10485:1642-1890(-)
MDPMLCISGDWIYRAFEIGDKMYFIYTGIAQIYSKEHKFVIRKLEEGQFFSYTTYSNETLYYSKNKDGSKTIRQYSARAKTS